MRHRFFTLATLLPLMLGAGSAMAQQRLSFFNVSTGPTYSFSGFGSTSLFSLTSTSRASQLTVSPWMSPDVGSAWNKGYLGQGTTVHVLDQFNVTPTYTGNLTGTTEVRTHGDWVQTRASMIAPLAKSVAVDNMSNTPLLLNRGLNVANLSYQVFAPAGQTAAEYAFDRLDSSVISHAQNGAAVVVKAAGNQARAVNTPTIMGNMDYLNLAFRGAKSAIYVGALSTNGTVAQPARIADYSNTAGTDPVTQKQFLVVGVNSAQTQMEGTSHAAPIVSAYAAIVGSKFTRATPTQVTNQLLSTARKDTISGYNVAVHGQGEASLSRALAPNSIK